MKKKEAEKILEDHLGVWLEVAVYGKPVIMPKHSLFNKLKKQIYSDIFNSFFGQSNAVSRKAVK